MRAVLGWVGKGKGFPQDQREGRIKTNTEKSCKYMQMSPAGGRWEEDPAGDFVLKVWSRPPVTESPRKLILVPPPPPDLLLLCSGLQPRSPQFKALPVITYFRAQLPSRQRGRVRMMTVIIDAHYNTEHKHSFSTPEPRGNHQHQLLCGLLEASLHIPR